MDREKLFLLGPHQRAEGWGGQEDVADGVAMAALPPCVVITCSNGTKEVERKVYVLGVGRRTGTGAWGREGTEKSLRDFFTLWLCKAYSLSDSMCLRAWDSLHGVFQCVCVSLYSWRTRGHRSFVGPGNEHIIQSQNLLPHTASCPGLPRQGPSLPWVCHGLSSPCSPTSPLPRSSIQH